FLVLAFCIDFNDLQNFMISVRAFSFYHPTWRHLYYLLWFNLIHFLQVTSGTFNISLVFFIEPNSWLHSLIMLLRQGCPHVVSCESRELVAWTFPVDNFLTINIPTTSK